MYSYKSVCLIPLCQTPTGANHSLYLVFPTVPLPPSSLSVCLPSPMIGCLLGLTYDSSLTLGQSKCPADSFAIISQFVLPVTVGTFGRQAHVKKAQRSEGARQVKDDRQHVSFIQQSSSTRLAELNSRYRHGTSPKLIVDLLPTLQSEELWSKHRSRTGSKHS